LYSAQCRKADCPQDIPTETKTERRVQRGRVPEINSGNNRMSVKSKELREQRGALVTKAQAILRQDKISIEDRATYDSTMSAAEALVPQIQAEERTEAESLYETRSIRDSYGARHESKREQEYRMAFFRHCRVGMDRLSNADRSLLVEHRDTDNSGQFAGTQSISYTEGSAGGFLDPAGFHYAPVLDGNICRVVTTASGAIMPWPTGDDTSNIGSILAENTQVSEVPVVLGTINFGAFKFTTNVIRVSVELLQDSAFGLDAYLMDRFAERIGRAMELYATTGNGSGQPTGIITAALANGSPVVVGAGSNANDGLGQAAYSTIGTNDIYSLIGAVDPSYRQAGKFMLNDTTLTVIKKLLDKYGRPIWQDSLSESSPGTIAGYKYVVNQSMAVPAASTNPVSVVFGDLNHFVIRRVKDLSVVRLSERYADYGQVGFLGFSRMDSNLVRPQAVALLQQHS
jgi:HK97 family phage major capsid protein